MENEIIIDGVNVAECQYYFYEDTEKAHTCRLIQVDDDLHYICKDNPNCYYKQLQRLKKENEELKSELELNTANAVVIDMAERLHNYKQALEEIRESFNYFRMSTMPFHIADNEKMPHRMADAIQHYSERIIAKINEVLK